MVPLPGEAAAFVGRHDAGERLLRRRLARLLIAAVGKTNPSGVRITPDAAGRPLVAKPHGWHLGLAARWPACLLAIARDPIGVDIELATEPLPDDLLTSAERRQIATMPRAERAMEGARRWAAKEAHAKWTGRPRALDPAQIETAVADVVTSPLGSSCCCRHEVGRLAMALCTAA